MGQVAGWDEAHFLDGIGGFVGEISSVIHVLFFLGRAIRRREWNLKIVAADVRVRARCVCVALGTLCGEEKGASPAEPNSNKTPLDDATTSAFRPVTRSKSTARFVTGSTSFYAYAD